MSKVTSTLTSASVGVLIGAVVAAGVTWQLTRPSAMGQGDHVSPASQPSSDEDEILYWTCGMHPSVRSDGPGKCPICHMDLVPVYASPPEGAGAEDVLSRLELSEQARALSQIETVPVAFRRLEHEINTSGRVTLNEQRVTHMHARVEGWIDEVFVEYTGAEITPGAPLVSIYSEELVTAQEEYLLATANMDQRGNRALAQAARQRLLRWGVEPEQVDALAESGRIDDRLILHYDPPPDTPQGGVVIDRPVIEGHHVREGDRLVTVADLTSLWVLVDIYEYEMAWVELGQRVEITTPAYPGRVFEGEIAFIEPILDTVSRAVQVRAEVPNPDMELRPEMWVDARIRVPLDRSSQVVQRMREDARRRWAERRERSEPLEVAATSPTTQPTSAPSAAYLCPMLCEGGEADEPGQHCPVCNMVMLPREEVLGETPASEPADTAEALYACPMHPEITGSSSDETCSICGMFLEPVQASEPTLAWEDAPEGTILAIPDLALLRTGQREIVYEEEEPGVYVGREVITGPTGHVMIEGQRELYVPVLAGLEPGMRVVTRGNFLLDSQTQLTGAASAAYGSALDTGDEGAMPPGMPGMQH